jgi:hypothetical protein
MHLNYYSTPGVKVFPIAQTQPFSAVESSISAFNCYYATMAAIANKSIG